MHVRLSLTREQLDRALLDFAQRCLGMQDLTLGDVHVIDAEKVDPMSLKGKRKARPGNPYPKGTHSVGKENVRKLTDADYVVFDIVRTAGARNDDERDENRRFRIET